MKNTTKKDKTETTPANTGGGAALIDDLEAADATTVLGGQSGLPTGIVSPRDPASRA